MTAVELTAREARKVARVASKHAEHQPKVYNRGRWAVRCYSHYRPDRCYSEFRHWFRWSAVSTLVRFTRYDGDNGATYRLERVGS